METTDWDACVIGAGPAGALAAMLLAQRGRRVLLVDKAKFPRPKVCGGCLGAVGLAALDEAGIALDELGVGQQPLNRVRVHAGSARADLPLRRRQAVSREAFDAKLLARAAAAGVTVVEDCRAAVGPACDRWRHVRLTTPLGRSEARSRIVLIAAGLGASGLLPQAEAIRVVRRPHSRVGAGATIDDPSGDYVRGCITMACGLRGEGYVGVVKLPDGKLDLAAAFAPAAIARWSGALNQLAAELLRACGLPVPPPLIASHWSAVPALTQRPTRLGAERVLLIGDAAGYVEPFTGEGMGWALRCALESTTIADDAIDAWGPGHVTLWERRHHATIGRLQRRCRAVCGLIGGRAVTPAIVRLLAAAPWAAAPVLSRIDPAPAA